MSGAVDVYCICLTQSSHVTADLTPGALFELTLSLTSLTHRQLVPPDHAFIDDRVRTFWHSVFDDNGWRRVGSGAPGQLIHMLDLSS